MDNTPLRQLRKGRLPQMVSWYDPRLLARVGVRTIISTVFGQYADQRLIQAVTDHVDDKELVNRYDYRRKANGSGKPIALDENGAFWIDYVADVGDGFESTYTTAYLLAQDSLNVPGAGRLTHGDILIMGGDQCYPQATREEYKKRLLQPFNWAFNAKTPERKLFAIPGNHDWYDGLAAFDSLFCSSRDKLSKGKGNVIGGWECQQHRSYWAIRLPYKWWIWGADIQFSKYLDTAQVNYFETVAEQMGQDDKLVICLAEPSWMLADLTGQDEEENFFKITTIARRRGARVCAVIAGDWHHYNRYYAPELDVHFFTSGGGGAFLHPTHVLKNSISVRWPEKRDEAIPAAAEARAARPGEAWQAKEYDIRLKRKKKQRDGYGVVGQVMEEVEDVLEPLQKAALGTKKKPLKPLAPKCYPDKGRSLVLSVGNVLFPFFNPGFAFGIGIIYWVITWQFLTLVDQHHISDGRIDDVGLATVQSVLLSMPLYIMKAMILSVSFVLMLGALFATLVWYVDAVERPGLRRYLTKFFVGSGHFLAHMAAMFTLAMIIVMTNNWATPYLKETLANLRQSGPGIIRSVAEETEVTLEREEQRQARQRVPVAADRPAQQSDARKAVGFFLYPVQMVVLGGLIGGSLWGFYWVLTGIFGRMHSEDAFAALRIRNYKNFLRLKFERDKLTIYPLGLDKLPRADHWMNAPPGGSHLPNNPALVAVKPINVRLIEPPIVIPCDPCED
jgi:hypothetical protein